MLQEDAVRLGQEAARRLALSGAVEIRPGLTKAEFAEVETTFGFEFADDHHAFLAAGLPINSRKPDEGATWERPWPDWRDADEEELRRHLDWPTRGMLDGIEDGGWLRQWGIRPGSTSAAVEIAERALAQVPRLVPIYGHRFLPAGRGTYGRQVLSIWGTDIISYGSNLAEYIMNDFYELDDARHRSTADPIPFWSDFIRQ